MEHASHLLSSLCNLPLIFTAIVLFVWSCSKFSYSFLISFWPILHICEQVFGLSWITYVLFRISEHSTNSSCWSKCPTAACSACPAPGTYLGQPGELHPSPKGAPGRSLPCPLGRNCWGLMREPGAGWVKAKHNLPAVWQLVLGFLSLGEWKI